VVCPSCRSRNVQPVFSLFSSSSTDKTSCDVRRPYT
jgi:hypothetical protein